MSRGDVAVSPERWDAVVVGAGPNGLAAAIVLARSGRSVLVLEAAEEVGGGTRSGEATLPGFVHDHCSAVHPMGALSPLFRELGLEGHGLEWVYPEVSVAHPLDDGPAPALLRSVGETAALLGEDGPAWRRLVEPFLGDPEGLMEDVLAPLRWPRHPLRMARFGWLGLRSARGLAEGRFAGTRARALFAGLAAHSILPLERPVSAAVGLAFAVTGHLVDWPVARGGSGAIARALASRLRSLGGEIRCGERVRNLAGVPESRAVVFDTSPRELAEIAGSALPSRYRRRLGRYRYGPGVFKVDWALAGPIPWRDEVCRRASTVHVGGAFDDVARAEAAAWRGEADPAPFLIVCQQSLLDPSRAPEGKHTGYAYCHVPNGWPGDETEAIERRIERYAPGFRDLVLARRTLGPADFERGNPSLVGGAVTGGAADLRQLFTRPVARWNPYTTPNPRLFLGSASTPPGGGVHGMCGAWAARAALDRVLR